MVLVIQGYEGSDIIIWHQDVKEALIIQVSPKYILLLFVQLEGKMRCGTNAVVVNIIIYIIIFFIYFFRYWIFL